MTLVGSLGGLAASQLVWYTWHSEIIAFILAIVLGDVTSGSGGRLRIHDAAGLSANN
jgi:hypothetical protein